MRNEKSIPAARGHVDEWPKPANLKVLVSDIVSSNHASPLAICCAETAPESSIWGSPPVLTSESPCRLALTSPVHCTACPLSSGAAELALCSALSLWPHAT